jgi:hypothetical protein
MFLTVQVFKGRKMPGRMGGKQRTVKNVWVYKIDPARNLMWVKGQVIVFTCLSHINLWTWSSRGVTILYHLIHKSSDWARAVDEFELKDESIIFMAETIHVKTLLTLWLNSGLLGLLPFGNRRVKANINQDTWSLMILNFY